MKHSCSPSVWKGKYLIASSSWNKQLLLSGAYRIRFKSVAASTLSIFHGVFVLTFLLVLWQISSLQRTILFSSILLLFLLRLKFSLICDNIPNDSIVFRKYHICGNSKINLRNLFSFHHPVPKYFLFYQNPFFHRQEKFPECYPITHQARMNQIFDRYDSL